MVDVNEEVQRTLGGAGMLPVNGVNVADPSWRNEITTLTSFHYFKGICAPRSQ